MTKIEDEKIAKIVEFKEAFERLTRMDGWKWHQWSLQDDDDGFFVQVTLEWKKPPANQVL